jgi:hypothetical protein
MRVGSCFARKKRAKEHGEVKRAYEDLHSDTRMGMLDLTIVWSADKPTTLTLEGDTPGQLPNQAAQ